MLSAMSEEKQLVVFTKDDRDQIATIVRELQPNEDSIAFRELSQTINVATGMLPQKVIPTGNLLSKDDDKVVINLGNQLSTGYIVELEKFVEAAREDLIKIHSVLFQEAVSGRLENELQKMKLWNWN
ncbi:unnamed protein product [Rotaria magnacalcarata]|uniref:Uncharacterized protein n=1 Tax=Rotaria magnacalcarata TaxID=392030 RepID=A0A816Z626_9BILA|nr:unnamed protein product [Rotaria magnacalcarata]